MVVVVPGERASVPDTELGCYPGSHGGLGCQCSDLHFSRKLWEGGGRVSGKAGGWAWGDVQESPRATSGPGQGPGSCSVPTYIPTTSHTCAVPLTTPRPHALRFGGVLTRLSLESLLLPLSAHLLQNVRISTFSFKAVNSWEVVTAATGGQHVPPNSGRLLAHPGCGHRRPQAQARVSAGLSGVAWPLPTLTVGKGMSRADSCPTGSGNG